MAESSIWLLVVVTNRCFAITIIFYIAFLDWGPTDLIWLLILEHKYFLIIRVLYRAVLIMLSQQNTNNYCTWQVRISQQSPIKHVAFGMRLQFAGLQHRLSQMPTIPQSHSSPSSITPLPHLPSSSFKSC